MVDGVYYGKTIRSENTLLRSKLILEIRVLTTIKDATKGDGTVDLRGLEREELQKKREHKLNRNS